MSGNILLADSCAGAISILKHIENKIDRDIIFLADYEKNPFGLKSKNEVQCIVHEWLSYFIENKKIELLFVGCNTASIAISGEVQSLKNLYNIPIVTMIDCLQNEINKQLQYIENKNVAIMGTNLTVNSNIYSDILKEKGARDIVPVIGTICESTVAKGKVFDKVSLLSCQKEIYKQTRNYKIDTLILGCTCFPFLIETIKSVLPSDVHFVDPALSALDLIYQQISTKPAPNTVSYLTTGKERCWSKDINTLLKLALNRQGDVGYLSIR